MQLRLTRRFAEEIKAILPPPSKTTSPFEDWIADIIFVERKKAVLLIDRQTLIAFVFPHAKAQGIKDILQLLSRAVVKMLTELQLDNFISHALETLSKPPVYVKTEDRKTLGHMNDFKFIIQHFKDQNSFDEISSYLHNVIVKTSRSIYQTPNELLKQILDREIKTNASTHLDRLL